MVQDYRKFYESHMDHPPLPWNYPPVAGAISWARNLLRKIEEHMNHFKRTDIITMPDAKRGIKEYNRFAKLLIEFEDVWLDAWKDSVAAALEGLRATVLVRHPQTNQLIVNFDRNIYILMREAKLLIGMGINLPSEAQVIFANRDRILRISTDVSHMVSEYNRVTAMIYPIYAKLIEPILARTDASIIHVCREDKHLYAIVPPPPHLFSLSLWRSSVHGLS